MVQIIRREMANAAGLTPFVGLSPRMFSLPSRTADRDFEVVIGAVAKRGRGVKLAIEEVTKYWLGFVVYDLGSREDAFGDENVWVRESRTDALENGIYVREKRN